VGEEEFSEFTGSKGVESRVLEVGWVYAPKVGVEACPVDRGGGAGVGLIESGLECVFPLLEEFPSS